MSCAVLYKSKYGTTKLYAGWTALKLGADLYEVSHFNVKDFKEYDTLIFGLPVYMDKIMGIEFLINNFEKIKEKNLIIFTVGAKSEKYVYQEKLQNIKKFHFRGKIDFNELNIKDKILLYSLKDRMNIKKLLLDEEKEFLDFIKKQRNLVNKKNVDCIIDFVENII